METDSSNVRIERILEGMSLAAKIGQMTMAERMWATPEEARTFGLGSVLSGGGSHPGENCPLDWVRMNDDYWVAMMEGEGAPGIPLLFGIDAVHGHNNVRGATLFPHNIGLGAADSEDLIADIASVTAREILATGLDWNFAPTLAVVQNPQWGRTYESFGSSPERAARFGARYVEALQAEGVIGCAKHWVGDGATLHGIDQGETRLTWQQLEADHVSPYYPALDAGVLSVMVSFNSWNGDKCHGHHHLVTQVLKGQLGFAGIVVSDWDGVDYLNEDFDEAVALAVNAGLDMFMVPQKWRVFIEALTQQVARGVVSEARIDDAVRRILRVKHQIGLLETVRPTLRPQANDPSFGGQQHRAIAREAVRRSQVLLKNEGALLPLSRNAKVLVTGRNADNLGHQCGGWTVSWQGEAGNDTIEGTSIWQAIRAEAPAATFSEDGVVAEGAEHDVAIVVIGERPYAEGFGDVRPGDDLLVQTGSMINGLSNPLEPYGRSLELAELHPEDLATLHRVSALGIPVVTVLVSGRPLIVNQELAASTAFVAAWLPGSEGAGVADVLFGRAGFSGKLPLPWPSAPRAQTDRSEFEHRFDAGFGLTTHQIETDSIDNVVVVDYKSVSSK